ncbi:hypothetical protein [Roseospira goensis]|uniref:GGDEF domain-containing protein n=1 Tax=Roseospira goensis TaxID=391922 RepID=A0A7W6S031_9PROT|nr:hypothetical protein [Roseospira goensis]MBB4286416.1 hypothetical protein [Roseospira goensis]
MSDEIAQPSPAPPVGWRRDRRRDRDAPKQGGEERGPVDYARGADAYARTAADGLDVDDSVSVQGIPPAELTPAVRRALGHLMAEIERLRAALAGQGVGEGGAAMPPHPLESGAARAAPSADEPPALPGPAALHRLLDAHLAGIPLGGPGPAVVFFYLGNHEDLRLRHGLAAAEAATRAMGRALAAARAEDEVMGLTGGAGVAAVLPFDGQVDRLWARARGLAKAAGAPLTWRGETLRPALLVGVHVTRRGERAADAVWQAERAARRIV